MSSSRTSASPLASMAHPSPILVVVAAVTMVLASARIVGAVTPTPTATATPIATDLYVGKAGTDSAHCGPITDQCYTVDGAQAIIRTNNDNGFHTCFGNNAIGCGQCGQSGTACNSNADCGGTVGSCSGTTCCDYLTCSNDSARGCAANADCAGGGACAGFVSARCGGLSACTGPSKTYAIHIGTGDYYETLAAVCKYGTNDGKVCSQASCTGSSCVGGTNNGASCTVGSQCPSGACTAATCVDKSPPEPGYVAYLGNGTTTQTRILAAGANDMAVFDGSNRSNISTTNLTLTNLGPGAAFVSTGGMKFSTFVDTGYVVAGSDVTNTWPVNITGTGNVTNSIFRPLAFASAPNVTGNGIHFQSWPPGVCTGSATRACNNNGDCSGAGTCQLDPSPQSSDFYVQGSQIEPVAGNNDGVAFWLEGKACGNAFNQVLADIDITGDNGGAGHTTTGIKVSRTDCDPNSPVAYRDQKERLFVRNVRVQAGNTAAGLFPFDVSVSVDSDSQISVMGPFVYDSCARSVASTDGIEYMNTTQFGGGPAYLGVLNCAAPNQPIDGELWYAAPDGKLRSRQNAQTVNLTGVARSIVSSGKIVTSPTVTNFFTFGLASIADAVVSQPFPLQQTATIKDLYCHTNGGPGAAKSYAVTVNKNGSASALTCTVSGTANPGSCNDTTHSFTVVAGDTYSFKYVPTGTPTSVNLGCSFIVEVTDS